MRSIEAIDADLRVLSRAWRSVRVVCDQTPSTPLIDQLLEERAAAVATRNSTSAWLAPQDSDQGGAIPSPL